MPSPVDYVIPTVSCLEASHVAIISDTHGRIDPRIAGGRMLRLRADSGYMRAVRRSIFEHGM